MAESLKRNRDINYIFRLNNALIKQKNRRMAEYGLTSIQADVLVFILMNYEKREVNQLDVQAVFKLTNPTVSGIVDRLEEKGFIKRVRSEKDARFRSLVALPKGIALDDTLRHSAAEAENYLVQNMSESEQAEFERLLKVALDTVEEC